MKRQIRILGIAGSLRRESYFGIALVMLFALTTYAQTSDGDWTTSILSAAIGSKMRSR